MVSYYGDFAEDDTVDIPFNTFTSNDPSASSTITDFINTDVHIHKDGGLTQRNNAAGITVSVDFDGITGNHLVKIDTSDDTVGGFWVTGSEYQVRIEGTTVDGATVNSWIGAFSIERAGGTIALLKLIQAAVITNAAGADIAADIIALKAETVLILADTSELQVDDYPTLIAALPTAVEIQAEMEENGASLLDTIRDQIGTAGDGLTAINLPNQTMDIVGNITGNLSGTVGSVTGAVGSVTGAVGSVTGNVGGNVVGSVASVVGAVGSVTGAVGSVTGTVGSVTGNVGGNVTGSVGSLVGHTVQTGDSYARIGAPAGASIAADLVVIDNFVDNLETRIPDTISLAAINAEIVDTLATDTHAEPAQGAPGATISLKDKIGFLYKAWRNKTTQTATEMDLYNDAGAVVDQKSTVSDDATTFTKGEIATGP